MFSSTTAAWCAPRRWPSTWGTTSHPCSPANCNASGKAIYESRVFFIRHLGFITPTEARRISFEDTVRFEQIHEETYRARLRTGLSRAGKSDGTG